MLLAGDRVSKVSVNDLSVQLALAFGPEVKQEPTSDKEEEEENHESQEDAPARGSSDGKVSKKKRVLTRRDSLIDIHANGHAIYFWVHSLGRKKILGMHSNHWPVIDMQVKPHIPSHPKTPQTCGPGTFEERCESQDPQDGDAEKQAH